MRGPTHFLSALHLYSICGLILILQRDAEALHEAQHRLDREEGSVLAALHMLDATPPARFAN